MELKQLEYFRAIVDAGTISGAATPALMLLYPLPLLPAVRLFLSRTSFLTLLHFTKKAAFRRLL